MKPQLHKRALALITASCALTARAICARAADTTWLNAGANWLTPGNWSSGVPGTSIDATFPAAAAVVTPDVSAATVGAAGISLDNSGPGGAYSISGASGTISLGADGMSVTGGGTSSVAPAVALAASTLFNVGAGSTLRLNGALDPGAFSATKSGGGTLVLGAASGGSGMPFDVNEGALVLTNGSALGASPNVTVNGGGVLHLDTPASPTSDVNFNANQLVLNNGATLRGGGASPGFITTLTASGVWPAVQNGAAVTIDVPENDDQLIINSPIHNTAEALTGIDSTIHVTGNGVLQLGTPATGTNAYSGSWNIDHSIIGGEAGATVLDSVQGFGARTGGAPASVTLTSGFLIDTRSSSASRVPNPITLAGGFLNTSATLAGISRSGAFFGGTITINSVPDGSGLDMEDLFSNRNLSTTLSGVVTGPGTLFVFAKITAPSIGVLSLTNTSLLTPNTESGTFSVTNKTALDASSSALGSDPLGAATVSLSGGTLRLNHAGIGNNGVISAYAANSVEVFAMDSAFGDQNGSITIGSGGANTGNTIEMGALSFNATGVSANQTLTISNAINGINYGLRFTGITTLAGNCTFTTGATPANVELVGKVTGSGNLIKAGNNSLTLSGVSSDYTGATTVNAGTLIFNATHQIAALSIASGTRAIVSAGGDKVLSMQSLSIAGTGKLDLNDNDAVLDYPGGSVIASVASMIASGYAGGTWAGGGITSGAATATVGTPHLTALGYAEATDVFSSFPASFSGINVDDSSVLIRYTYAGDANIDGTVDTIDFNLLAASFSQSSKRWFDGDFDYSGTVDTIDFNLLVSNFSLTLAAPAVAREEILAPEPVLLMLVGPGVCASLLRRRRFTRN